jgi:TonB family protein
MKQKIKIMKRRQDVSEDEIRSYMNFEDVLAKRNIIAGHWRNHFLKWSIPLVVTVAIVITWQIMEEPVTETTIPTSKEVLEIVKPPHDANKLLPAKDSVSSLTGNLKFENQPGDDFSALDTVSETIGTQVTDSLLIQPKSNAYSPATPVEGYDHLYRYFNEHLVYPPEALKDSVQGVLTVVFTINQEGKPEQIYVMNSLGALFEKEAVRLIESMPAWKPAVLNGQPVKSKMSLPLTFRINRIKLPPEP